MKIAKKTRLLKLGSEYITNGNAYKDCQYRVDIIDLNGNYKEHYFTTIQEAQKFQNKVQILQEINKFR